MKTLYVHTNQGREQIKFPQYWHEVTTGMYESVFQKEELDLIELFALFSGMPYKVVSEQRNIELEAAMLEAISFAKVQLKYDPDQVPSYLTLRGSDHTVPKNLGALTFGQNLHIREMLDKGVKPETLLSFVVAIYMHPIIDGTAFDKSKVEALQEEIKKLPITEVYHIGFFFLLPLLTYGSSSLSLWIRTFLKVWCYFIRRGNLKVSRPESSGWLRLSI